MARYDPATRRGVGTPAAGLDVAKMAAYLGVLLLLLAGADIVRRALRMVRPTTVAVAAARREARSVAPRQTTRVRILHDHGAPASRPNRPSERFLSEVQARTGAGAPGAGRSESDPWPVPPRGEAEIFDELARAGTLRDMSASQHLQLSHPTEGARQLSGEQRLAPEALSELRRAGAVIR